jgi:hypothetical protein
MALAVFEGYCYQCEEQGHKADACPKIEKVLLVELWQTGPS